MSKVLATLVVVLVALPAGAAIDHSHRVFDGVLQKHVKNGAVSYGALAKDRSQLDTYIRALGATTAAEVERLDKTKALAFWINAYNAFTLDLILKQKPKRSIRDIDGAWDKFQFAAAGRSLTLNNIEHSIIRKKYPDARIHAVLVCAAKSCPILESRAFSAADLDERLEAAAHRFATNARRNRYVDGRLEVSKIFEWYGDDFIAAYAKKGGGSDKNAAIRGFMSHHLGKAVPVKTPVRYMEYDWSLNGTW